MGSSEINKENIITATMEELTEEERKAYLLVEEHVKAQFLKGFKKDRGSLVKRVEEFILPSLKLRKDKIEEIPNVSLSPSDMFDRMSWHRILSCRNENSYRVPRHIFLKI